MSAIAPSVEELSHGQFSPETLFIALNSFNRDGFLVLEGVEDAALMKQMNEEMMPERQEVEAALVSSGVLNATHKAEDKPTKNCLHGPPSHRPELGSHKLYKNPFVLQVLNAYLGPRPQFIYTAGNNAGARGTERQRVHTDVTYLHPEAPYMVAAQWVLSDFSPANGATEVWPGSHRLTTNDDHVYDPKMNLWIKEQLVKERARSHPPVQVECKVGGVFLRDMRLWHAGMPNTSDVDRIMLACGYSARWYQCRGTVKLPHGVEHLYESNDQVEVMAEYLPLDQYKQYRHKIMNDQFHTKLILPSRMGVAA